MKPAFLPFIAVLSAWASEPASLPPESEIFPYIRAVTGTSAVIMAHGFGPAPGRILYGTTPDYGSEAPFLSGRADLSRLEPGTRYFYTLARNGQPVLMQRDTCYFHTPPSNQRAPFTFAVIGDTKSGGEAVSSDHREVVMSILRYSSPDLLLHTGDIAGSGDRGWKEFFRIESPLLRRCPLYPVRGSGEWVDGDFRERFFPADSVVYYSFTHGNVFFICLDIDEGRKDSWYEKEIGPKSAQYGWLESALRSEAKKQADFIVVLFHLPLFPAEGDGNGYVRDLLSPLFERHGVDLVLNGNRHYFSFTRQGGITYLVTGGGGAALNRIRKKKSGSPDIYHPLFHHVRVRLNYPVMQVDALDNGGTIFFSQSLSASELSAGTDLSSPENPEETAGTRSMFSERNLVKIAAPFGMNCSRASFRRTRNFTWFPGSSMSPCRKTTKSSRPWKPPRSRAVTRCPWSRRAPIF